MTNAKLEARARALLAIRIDGIDVVAEPLRSRGSAEEIVRAGERRLAELRSRGHAPGRRHPPKHSVKRGAP